MNDTTVYASSQELKNLEYAVVMSEYISQVEMGRKYFVKANNTCSAEYIAINEISELGIDDIKPKPFWRLV